MRNKSVLTFLWLVYKRLRNWKGVEFSLIRKEMPVTTHYFLRCAIFESFLKYVLFCRNSQMRPSLWIVGRSCVHAPGFGFPLIKNCSLYRVYNFSNHCFSKFHIRTLDAKCTENAICWIISLHPESFISMKDWPGKWPCSSRWIWLPSSWLVTATFDCLKNGRGLCAHI